MFTDLRGFTSFSESLTPAQVIEVLNHYLSEMSDAILDNGGTLVAYMGDGIFAVFGAPLAQPDHADRALRTAREMLETRLPRFNEWIRSQGLGDGFRMGIGLNSGNVMSATSAPSAGSNTPRSATRLTRHRGSRGSRRARRTSCSCPTSPARRSSNRPTMVFVDEVDIRGRVSRMKLWGLNESLPAPPAQTVPTAEVPG